MTEKYIKVSDVEKLNSNDRLKAEILQLVQANKIPVYDREDI